jgi:hypothetical protein
MMEALAEIENGGYSRRKSGLQEDLESEVLQIIKRVSRFLLNKG